LVYFFFKFFNLDFLQTQKKITDSKAERYLSQLITLHQYLAGGKSSYDKDIERLVQKEALDFSN